MRLRKKSPPASASQTAASSACSPPSSASSSSSNTTNSLASSTDSSGSTSADLCLFSPASKRCQGLDLLVKAIHLVTAGSIVGVPYIQRRVLQRRRRSLKFSAFAATQFKEEELHIKTRSMLKRQSRMMGLPSK